MKIGIDATVLGDEYHNKGGIYHYILNLMKAFKEIDHENQYKIWFHFFRKDSFQRYKEACNLLDLGSIKNFKIVKSNLPNYRGWYMRLPVDFFIGPVNIFHGPAHFVMPVISGKSIVTIHDTDFIKIPDYLDRGWVEYKGKYTHLSIKRADIIITISNYMKSELIESLKIPEEKIQVVYQGVSPDFTVFKNKEMMYEFKNRYGIKIPYILFVGTFHKNKNLIRLIEAFHRLKMSSDLPHQLVLAGGKGELTDDLNQRIQELDIADMVVLPGYISEEDILKAYNYSDLFVFPSLFEGFGMPVLEAMACGVPVVASSVCSLPEVVGDAGLLVDPMNVESIAEGMYRVLYNDAIRNELIQKGFKRARLFSWEKTARETIEIYRKAYLG
jgi:glycosyltransferase involved in cell wall biosynthesis